MPLKVAQEDSEAASNALASADATKESAENMRNLRIKSESKKAMFVALEKVNDAEKEVAKVDANVTQAPNAAAKRVAGNELAQAKERLAKANDDAAKMETVGSIRTEQDSQLREALKDIYKFEAEEREALNEKETDAGKDDGKLKNIRNNLDAAKVRWQVANRELQAIGTKASVMSLESEGMETMKIALRGHVRSLDDEINTTQAQLGSTSAGLTNAPSAIIGVAENKTLIRTGDDASTKPGSATAALGKESADVWTKVTFSVGSESSSSSTKESNISGSASLEVGNWWASVKASTSFSSSSKKIESAMSSCAVSGSFSAMVVNIKRPWLYSDLFSDFDIDISDATKLSPGSKQIKDWVEGGDTGSGADKRTDYGKFPAYPTAFIVAADTVLEVRGSSCPFTASG